MFAVAHRAGRSRRRFLAAAAAALSLALLAAVPAAVSVAAVAQPRIVSPQCPGVGERLGFEGFPPGTYTLSSSYVTFSPDTFTVSADGMISPAVTATVDNDAPTTFEVDATPAAAGSTAYVLQWKLAAPSLHYLLSGSAYQVSGYCFGPGDTVDIAISGDQTPEAPATVLADAGGNINFEAHLTAGAARKNATVSATDTKSGRVLTGIIPLPATTMQAGAALTSADTRNYQQLYSPNMTYWLRQYGCTAELAHLYSANGALYDPVVWWAGTGSNTGSCALRMLTTGDLVLDNTATGKQLWHTGTEGTGSANRLVVQDDGNLVVYTAAGHPVWTRKVGLIRGPNGYLTRLSISSVRSGSWVGIGGVIKEFNINGALVPAAGRRVDLERKVGTAWQVIGTATANSTGHLWFSMRQAVTSYYRWYVPATRYQTSAVSISTER
jgi:hypothetical protein